MLSRRWLINFALLCLVILFTYVGNKYDVKPGYQPGNRITSLDAATIHNIGIKIADESLLLRRADAGWSIESPIRWPADNVAVARLLAITRSETDSRLPATDIDLASIGLQFPRAMLQLDDTSILFGDTNNIGERRYIMIDATVYLLPDLHLPFFSRGVTGLVDRRLLPASIALQSLKLSEFELSLSSQGRWESSASSAFSDDQLQALIDNWQGLPAKAIRAYKATTIPKQKLVATLADGSRLDFYLLAISPEIVIANAEIELQYHFDSSFYYQLISLRDEGNAQD